MPHYPTTPDQYVDPCYILFQENHIKAYYVLEIFESSIRPPVQYFTVSDPIGLKDDLPHLDMVQDMVDWVNRNANPEHTAMLTYVCSVGGGVVRTYTIDGASGERYVCRPNYRVEGEYAKAVADQLLKGTRGHTGRVLANRAVKATGLEKRRLGGVIAGWRDSRLPWTRVMGFQFEHVLRGPPGNEFDAIEYWVPPAVRKADKLAQRTISKERTRLLNEMIKRKKNEGNAEHV